MSHPEQSTFGDTISRGIQDVAALLPLLGTDQCERHVGAALEKGYIYAAATPLSIFGSLGIVKTSFATFLACTTKVFYGGKWFHHAGFGTTASVTSMVTIASGTKLYGAEVKFQELLKEQHLDDPGLIDDVDWFGWEKRTIESDENSSPRSKWFSFSWTFALVSGSALSAAISLSPYMYLNQNRWGLPLSWIFPVFRSFGSMLCVTSVQLALQHRIHRIVKSSLLLMKARKDYPLSYEDADKDMNLVMEARLNSLRSELKGDCQENGSAEKRELRRRVEVLLSVDFMLLIHQVLILAGMMMTIAGYVGCFNLVSESNAKHGPYVWLGMEAFLSVLRMVLWGGNPSWAQGDTGLEMKLSLVSAQSKGDSAPDVTSLPEGQVSVFPLITTPHLLSRLSSSKSGVPRQSFVAVSLEDFLAAATPYVGHLRRLELDGISLFLAIVPDIDGHAKRKFLCLTARRNDSEWASISVFVGKNDAEHTVYSSRSRGLRGAHSRSIQLTLEELIVTNSPGSAAYIDNRIFHLVMQYSYTLFRRLFVRNPFSSIQTLWTLTLPTSSSPESTVPCNVLLTRYDEKYINTRQVKGEPMELGSLLSDPSDDKSCYLVKYGALFASALLEIHLCVENHRFALSMGLSEAAARPLAWEWIRTMGERILLEKRESRKRTGDRLTDSIDVEDSWDLLSRELRSLRQIRADSVLFKSWEGLMDAIFGNSGREIPNANELLELRPFAVLPDLTVRLQPLLVNFSDGTHTQAYLGIIDYVRSPIDHPNEFKKSTESKYHGQLNTFGPNLPSSSHRAPKYARGPSEQTLVNEPNTPTEEMSPFKSFSHDELENSDVGVDETQIIAAA
ncbi:hypothetical protein AAF712_010641 [Marasmius tenuissimus]|uniref:Uncharacterized protein n=1 Tax=Marasmius tenuissimus TaxID=585030 RepID=A0ABR2ZLG4_9AGAR